METGWCGGAFFMMKISGIIPRHTTPKNPEHIDKRQHRGLPVHFTVYQHLRLLCGRRCAT
jgi:hypothetical protein